jgi:glycosyltransferase involved in cell wall biosynthesis
MRIVQLNLAADPALREPGGLLDRYHTLTGWSRALTRAGCDVHVVQRFSTDATIADGNVTYEFVREGPPGTPAPWTVFTRVIETVGRSGPDVVHVNGLIFPGMVSALRDALGPGRVIVLQDHSGALPKRTLWPLTAMRAARWSRAFRAADAVSFTAPELARRWHRVGLPSDIPVLAIAEASTEFEPIDYADARESTATTGAPAILWVGRLNANKDPETVLSAVERVVHHQPTARLWLITPPSASQDLVRRRIDNSASLSRHVTMIGPVPHQYMPAHYSAADIFVSASRHEGSGYALIEAMACGVLPCVTDIPAFRALTHGSGELWRAGDPDACAIALQNAARRVSAGERRAMRAMFAQQLSWDVLARQTMAAYRGLMQNTQVPQ